jgi:rod shape-determining protein MreD
MNPLLAARLRIAGVLVVAVLVQTTIGSDLRVRGAAPDFMVLVAICAGLTGGAEHGAFVGFFAGLLTDLLVTNTPLGLCAFTYCVIGYAVGLLRAGLLPEGWTIRPPVTMVATGAAVALFVGAGDIVGQSQLVVGGASWLIKVALVEAVFNGVLAYPVGRFYERIARNTKGAEAIGAGRADRAVVS